MGSMRTNSTQQPKLPVVLAATDFSPLGQMAVDRAFEMASWMRAQPHVAHIAEAHGDEVRIDQGRGSELLSWDEALELVRRLVQHRLEDYYGRGGSVAFDAALSHLRTGDPAREIAQLASALQADLVVVGTHGRTGLKRVLLGSVAEKTVRLAPCPVVVVREKQEPAEPALEPPCPKCIAARQQSGGRRVWCDDHEPHLGRRHTYHYVPRSAATRENAPLVYPMDR